MKSLQNPLENDRIHFVQVERKALRELRLLGRKSMKAVEVVMWMMEKMDRRGALVASRKTMAAALGVSEETIKRAVKVLVDEGFVQRISLGPGTVSAFAVNARVGWAGPRAKLTKLAHFQATVVAHLDDQDEAALSTDPLKKIPDLVPPDLAVISENDDDDEQGSLPGV